ncbi:hypothetical protein [Jiangella anatolica]|uniref:hypothetical protein n=1 Tax=Jiangella anatolica TaxID=2670374 RepID=UPI0011B51D03|nr:hypothetical protein [Jiangella anatolica]
MHYDFRYKVVWNPASFYGPGKIHIVAEESVDRRDVTRMTLCSRSPSGYWSAATCRDHAGEEDVPAIPEHPDPRWGRQSRRWDADDPFCAQCLGTWRRIVAQEPPEWDGLHRIVIVP